MYVDVRGSHLTEVLKNGFRFGESDYSGLYSSRTRTENGIYSRTPLLGLG